jgi:hypothetical protein
MTSIQFGQEYLHDGFLRNKQIVLCIFIMFKRVIVSIACLSNAAGGQTSKILLSYPPPPPPPPSRMVCILTGEFGAQT